jgi:ribosomal-protein-alanine N-acetyltransferase
MNVALRPLRVEDIPQAAEIEQEAFPTLWPPTPFKRELNNRLACYLVAWMPREDPPSPPNLGRGMENHPPDRHLISRLLRGVKGLLSPQEPRVEVDYTILGLVGIWFMVDEAHITTIAVRRAWRGRGIGELLLIGAIRAAMARGSRVVTLEVRTSNRVAQSLYEKYGFKRAGLRRGYYTDNNEDAIIMTTDPIQSPSFQESFQQLVERYRQRHGEIVAVLT